MNSPQQTQKKGRYVLVSRAVDSDRGEIDVNAFSWDAGDDFYVEGGRYERSEYRSARAEAEQIAAEHDIPLTDEVGS